jgi:hypothetical protein
MYVYDPEPELEPEPEPEPESYSDKMSEPELEPEPSTNFPVPQPCLDVRSMILKMCSRQIIACCGRRGAAWLGSYSTDEYSIQEKTAFSLLIT